MRSNARKRPGESIHIDTKKLDRIDEIGHRIAGDRRSQSAKCGTGGEVLHVAIDEASRLACTEVVESEKRKYGARMTDHGSAYRSVACRDV